jgi:hypothetical protein
MLGPERDWPRPGPAPGWARATGALPVVDLRRPGSDVRHPAETLLASYCWALDERLEALLADCFADDAVLERMVAGGEPLVERGRGRIVDHFLGGWGGSVGQRRHFLLDTVFEELSPTEARTVSRLLVTRAAGTRVEVLNTGFHRVWCALTGHRWEILRLEAGFDLEESRGVRNDG